MEFKPFDKIPRLKRDCVITEKIDGTNAQIVIAPLTGEADENAIAVGDGYQILAGSRARWITPGQDNYGFAAWVRDNSQELIQLGPGQHFGEWWGAGIQRRYGLTEKRFSLFNTGRWCEGAPPPSCCSVVPVLYSGVFSTACVESELLHLHLHGSAAAPGFMNPEGIVVYHYASGKMFKRTLDNDGRPKGQVGSE